MTKHVLDSIKELIEIAESLPSRANPVDVGRLHGLATIARIKLEVYEGLAALPAVAATGAELDTTPSPAPVQSSDKEAACTEAR